MLKQDREKRCPSMERIEIFQDYHDASSHRNGIETDNSSGTNTFSM